MALLFKQSLLCVCKQFLPQPGTHQSEQTIWPTSCLPTHYWSWRLVTYECWDSKSRSSSSHGKHYPEVTRSLVLETPFISLPFAHFPHLPIEGLLWGCLLWRPLLVPQSTPFLWGLKTSSIVISVICTVIEFGSLASPEGFEDFEKKEWFLFNLYLPKLRIPPQPDIYS